MKNQILSSIGLGAIGIALTAQAAFPDVPSSHPHFDAIAYLQAEGIVAGNPDGTYQPEGNISRAAFTKIIVETYFSENEINNCSTTDLNFSDVESNTWFAPYVCVAVQKNLVQGYDNNTFRPGNTINVAEAAKIISAHRNGVQTGTPWFKPYIQDLSNAGAIPTQVSNVEQSVNRGVMAEMIYRLETSNTNKPNRQASFFFPEPAPELPMQARVNIPRGEFNQTGNLVDVSGGVGSGTAEARFENGKYTLVADMQNLPELTDDFFYEGWIVRTGIRQSVVSTGEAFPQDGKYINVYETNQDLSDHLFYVLTLEPDDGNPAPAEHILEGTLETKTKVKTEAPTEVEVMTKAKIVNEDFSQTQYEALLANGDRFILNFHADWCPSCQKLDKTLEAQRDELSDETIVLKVDYDNATALKQEFGVTQQTTGVFFENGISVKVERGLSFDDIKDFF